MSRTSSTPTPSNTNEPVDLWQLVAEHKAEEEKKEGEKGRGESTVLFVGGKQSGKSTLLHAYMFKDKVGTTPNSTSSLEYKYTRSSVGMNDRELTHIWELGGGRSLVNLLNIAIHAESVREMMLMIVVDLSAPSRVMDDLMYWIKTVRHHIQSSLSQTNSALLQQLQAEAKKSVW